MRLIALFICIVSVATGVCAQNIKDGWKGIKLFETNRKAVEKQFGAAAEEDPIAFYYAKGFLIRIEYSREPCAALDAFTTMFTVPKDTVIEYWVAFESEKTKLSDITWNRDLYERVVDTHQLWFIHYYDKKDNISLTTIKYREEDEFMRELWYAPSSQMKERFGCKK